jgi:S-formylglutathione hydrolase FrmB
MGEAIVVAPDCFTRWGGAQYLDSLAIGHYETHVVREVVPAIDARFRTIATREARAIGGKSSGGFGALVLAMRNPELFSAVASHAGDMYFELSAMPDLPVAARALRRHGGIGGFLRQFETKERKDGADFTTMMVLAQAGAYSPDPKREHGIALPFDLDTGEIDWTVWQRWKAWDPVEMIATHAEALRRMNLIFVDAGTRDEHNLDLGARILVRRLRTLGIACEHQEFDDGHRSTAYRYDISLPRLAAAIGASAG